jgi:ribosomal protein L19
MMNSRQIVDLIRKESQKETDEKIVSAYNRIIERIEVMEDIDISQSRNRFFPTEETSYNQKTQLTKEQAMVELNKLFNKV